jgi:hypothetical protein
MADENKFILDVDVKPLKLQLKEANQELQKARQKFGEFSNEAIQAGQKVGAIKDAIEGANESAALFDPGKKFQSLTTVATQAAAGVQAVQGAFALFGSESENVQKALLKVQGAMALTQGLSELKDLGKSWEQVKIGIKGATSGLSGFKKALLATGIGALVVAVGLLVAYWEDIKGLVNGVSGEQEKLNKEAEKNVKAQTDAMDALDSSDEILKSQGKSEKEILELKMKQTEQVIAAQEEQIKQAKITKDSQVAAAKRNAEITKQIVRGGMEIATAGLRLLALPIDAVIKTANEISKALGFGEITTFSINEQITKMNESVSEFAGNMLFDPKGVEEEGDKSIKEMEKTLLQSKNKYAGYQNQIKEINNKGNKERSDANQKAQEEQDRKREEAEQVLYERRKSLKSEQDQQLMELDKKYEEDKKKLKAAGITDFKVLDDSYAKEKALLDEKYRKEEEQKTLEFETQLAQIKFDTRLALMKEGKDKELEQLNFDYQNELAEIERNENLTAERKAQLKLAAEEKLNADKKVITDNYLKQEIDGQIAQLDLEAKNAEASLQIQRDLLDKKQALLKEQFDKGLITETEYNAGLQSLSDARKEIDNKEAENKEKLLSGVSNILKSASELAGKQTAAGKALAIAGATIDTFQSATAAYKSLAGIPVVGPALGAVAAGLAIATGLKNIREIAKTKVPNSSGGGGSVPSVSGQGAAPNIPQQATIGNSPITSLQQITQQSQQPIRAFVVESEVTSVQNRVSDIERRAGF